ncbi:12814_t:CDS:2, partial [Acaulospora colombiana]
AESGYISVRGLKAFKALNIEKELYPYRSREEIDENINKLKYKLEAKTDTSLYGSLRQTLENVDVSNLTWRDPEASMVISDDSFMSLASKARRNIRVDEERMEKKPDIMGLLKQDEKILELIETLDGMSFIGSSCRPVRNQFGIVGLQIAGTDLLLNVLVNDLGGIP